MWCVSKIALLNIICIVLFDNISFVFRDMLQEELLFVKDDFKEGEKMEKFP